MCLLVVEAIVIGLTQKTNTSLSVSDNKDPMKLLDDQSCLSYGDIFPIETESLGGAYHGLSLCISNSNFTLIMSQSLTVILYLLVGCRRETFSFQRAFD